MLYSDIRELKTMLEIPDADTSEDRKLGIINEQVGNWLEEWTNRKFQYGQWTEVYKGTNTQKMPLRRRPVYANQAIANPATQSPPQVYYDSGAYYGSAQGAWTSQDALMTYGVDFCLQLDQSDGITSRCAILNRIGNYWLRPSARAAGLLSPFYTFDTGSYRVTYTAGMTVNQLPAQLRLAADLLVSRLRWIIPTGQEVSNESYEERSVGFITSEKMKLMSLCAPLLQGHRNWSW